MTLLTVGYGDLSINSKIGYFIVVIEIITVLVMIPTLVNRLTDTLKNQSTYRTQSYSKSSEETHVVVGGCIGNDAMKTFCRELFHDDHDTMKG